MVTDNPRIIGCFFSGLSCIMKREIVEKNDIHIIWII